MSSAEHTPAAPDHPALPWLRLLRIGTVFSPAADVVAGLCLAGLPWSGTAVQAVVASACVYAAGMVLNDHADRRIDARQRPERPIPSGRIAPRAAFALGLGLLVAGVLVAPGRGYWAVLAALVLAYDYVLKRNVAAGAVTMGVLRAMNLAAPAAVLAAGPLPQQVSIAAGVYGIYIVAVTLLGVLEDEARVEERTLRSLLAVPPLVATLAMLAMPRPWPATALAFALAAAFWLRVRRVSRWDRAAIRGSMTWLLLGTMLYTGLLCLAAGRPIESVAVVVAVVPARWVSRRIALT